MASFADMKDGVWVNGRRLVAEKGSAGTETVRWKPSVTPVVGVSNWTRQGASERRDEDGGTAG